MYWGWAKIVSACPARTGVRGCVWGVGAEEGHWIHLMLFFRKRHERRRLACQGGRDVRAPIFEGEN